MPRLSSTILQIKENNLPILYSILLGFLELSFYDKQGADQMHQPSNLEDQLIFGQSFPFLAVAKPMTNYKAAVYILLTGGPSLGIISRGSRTQFILLGC